MNPRLTRHELLRRGAAGGALLAFPSILAACGGGGGGGDADGGELKDVLNFANWPYYIDIEKPTTLQDFTKQTGIKVNYYEEINDNADYFAKVQGPLSQGNGIDRDIFVFTDNSRFPGLLVNEGWVQELDKELIPNITNLVEAQASPPFDPDRTYSLPWQSGMTGIAWNEDLTGPVTIGAAAARGPEAQGQGDDAAGDGGLGRPRHARRLATTRRGHGRELQQGDRDRSGGGRLGADPALHGERLRTAARDRATSRPRSRGRATWSQLLPDNPKLKWAIPESGGMIWTDNMLIPTGGSVPTASTYMNYVYDPAVAARLAKAITYVTPVKGAKEELAKTDPETANNPLIFPDDDTLSQVKQFDSVALDNEEYITLWQGVLGQ